MRNGFVFVAIGLCGAWAFGCARGRFGADDAPGRDKPAGRCEDPDAWLGGEPPLGCPDDILVCADEDDEACVRVPAGRLDLDDDGLPNGVAPDDGQPTGGDHPASDDDDDGTGDGFVPPAAADDGDGSAPADPEGSDDEPADGQGGGEGGREVAGPAEEQGGGGPADGSIATKCYWADGAADDAPAVVRAEWQDVQFGGQAAIRVRLVVSESFVDNTFGLGSSDGYGAQNAPHQFSDLLDDALRVGFTDEQGAVLADARLDYLSVDAGAASGFSSLGLSGGDGEVVSGDASAVIGVQTSLAANLDAPGCLYTVDSPAADDPGCPGWERRVVYVVWLAAAAFERGFAHPVIESISASPSRMGSDTISVHAGPCPAE